MHLSDEHLQTLVNEQASKATVAQHPHIQECEYCHQRLHNMHGFTQALAASDPLTHADAHMLKSGFAKVLTASAATRNANKTRQANVSSLSANIKRVQVSIMAIAASMLIWVAYPYSSNTNNLHAQLSAVIEENRVLQQSVSALQLGAGNMVVDNNVSQLSNASLGLNSNAYQFAMQAKLKQIDMDIQRSYIENASTQTKIDLWTTRKQIMIKFLQQDTPQSVFII